MRIHGSRSHNLSVGSDGAHPESFVRDCVWLPPRTPLGTVGGLRVSASFPRAHATSAPARGIWKVSAVETGPARYGSHRRSSGSQRTASHTVRNRRASADRAARVL